jgi:hypothetical protein
MLTGAVDDRLRVADPPLSREPFAAVRRKQRDLWSRPIARSCSFAPSETGGRHLNAAPLRPRDLDGLPGPPRSYAARHDAQFIARARRGAIMTLRSIRSCLGELVATLRPIPPERPPSRKFPLSHPPELQNSCTGCQSVCSYTSARPQSILLPPWCADLVQPPAVV